MHPHFRNRDLVWDISHMVQVADIRNDIRRRMRALGSNMKRLSLDAGLGETYVRDLLTDRSKNPKTAEIQKVLEALDRAERAVEATKKGRA